MDKKLNDLVIQEKKSEIITILRYVEQTAID